MFLHTVSQDIGLKHRNVQRELRPLLSDHTVSDEILLKHVIKITSDECKRKHQLGQSYRHMVVYAYSAQSGNGGKEIVRVKS